MPYPDHLLARGETVVLHKHPHWKVLALPVLWLVVIVAAASFGIAFLHSRSSDPGFWPWVIVVAALLLLVFLVLVPFVKWRTEHFVLTDRHVFFRAGFFKRREHQIPFRPTDGMPVTHAEMPPLTSIQASGWASMSSFQLSTRAAEVSSAASTRRDLRA